MTLRNAFDNLATDTSVSLLRRIVLLLKPLEQITGGGSNRLSVDVNSGNIAISSGTVTTVTTVTTVSTVSNQANMGGVNAWELMKATSRNGWNSGGRQRLT